MCYRKDLFAKAGLPTDRAEVAKLFPDWASYFSYGRKFKAKVPGSAWYDSAVLTWEAMRNQLIQAYYSNQDRFLGAENERLKKTWDQVVAGHRGRPVREAAGLERCLEQGASAPTRSRRSPARAGCSA